MSAVVALYLVCSSLIWSASASDHPEAATELRHFTFEFNDDQDYDNQPDDWSRRHGRGFPHYVSATIDRTVGRHGRQSLRFDLNGGAAAYYSPLLRIDNLHSYYIRGALKTSDLHDTAALISVSLLDQRRKRIRRFLSKPVTGTHKDWVEVSIGPFRPDTESCFLVIGCHIVNSDRSDIRGQVWFDDLWVGGLPRLVLSPRPKRHYFMAGEQVLIESEAVGLDRQQTYRLESSLENVFGTVQSSESVPLQMESNTIESAGGVSRQVWKLPPEPPGFYRARVRLIANGLRCLERDLTFVVMDPETASPTGEFGWSLSGGMRNLSPEMLSEIARHAGIHWMKLPLWSASHLDSPVKASSASTMVDLLEAQRIKVVGLLSDPPPMMMAKFANRSTEASKIFGMPRDFWYPSLEPLIVRYAFRVRHWQLGGEEDTSFVGLSSLDATVNQVKQEFDRIGHDTQVGFRWDWGATSLPKTLPSGFLSQVAPPGVTADQLQSAGGSAAGTTLQRRWLVLPTERNPQATVSERAARLAKLMLAGKLSKAEVIFSPEPREEAIDLFNEDGSPGPMYLPWRTMATTLGGAEFLGRLSLPKRSENVLFQRDGKLYLILWSEQPVDEELYLGTKPYVTDLWGHHLPAQVDPSNGRLSIRATSTPVIVRDCSEPIVRWCLAVRFDKGQLKSEYGQHDEAILGANTFSQGVSGRVVLHMPPEWEVEPGHWELQASAGEQFRLPMLMTFPSDAALGAFRPTVDFEIAADRPYKFTVHLPYQLGSPDIQVSVTSRLLPDGRLEVEQKIVNQTSPPEMLDFSCSLFVPGHVRQKQFVTRLGQGEDKRFYYIPNGRALIGKTLWMRAEQIDGRRVLNQRHTVADPDNPASQNPPEVSTAPPAEDAAVAR